MDLNRRKPCVIGNWKMHGSRRMIAKLIEELSVGLSKGSEIFSEIDIVLCPPLVYLPEVQNGIQKVKEKMALEFQLGAQNVCSESLGAYTGEVSSEMLVDMGCRYVIVGHSERRTLFFEDDTLIARKFMVAYHTGLIPILCVGETQEERALGKTFEVIARQLEAVFEQAPITTLSKALIAYEPVWAIGTGLTATPEEAEAVHDYIRQWVKGKDPVIAKEARILYGGSVKAANASGLFAKLDIDGALVGGASLVAEEFVNICNCAKARVSWNKLS